MAFDRIFADVRKDIPNVPDAVVRQELFRVMDDFTQRTNIWQETIPFAIVVNQKTYTLPEPDEGKINRLLLVYNTESERPFWAAAGITMRVPGVIQLWYAPTTAANWAAVVAKRISEPLVDNYPVIDDWITDKYADTIGRGIVARLQFEPQKPYSNPMLAAVNQRAYISGCGLARANDEHANIRDGQSWRYPQGWATVQRKAFS